tara:strand:+ start:89570 stop:90682 length:1113 start_codon:yes stop_codon:yes gene_type:complete
MVRNNNQSLRRFTEEIMRGHRSPSIFYPLLKAMEQTYKFVVWTRNWLYDIGFLKTAKPDCLVISIGNLTVGGSGKTPFVEFLARKLTNSKIGILSRGYKAQTREKIQIVSDGISLLSSPPDAGDEPYMLGKKLRNVPVVCTSEKLLGAKFMLDKFDVNIILLDDGFQTRYIARDLDIVLINAQNPFGSGSLIPLGILREPTNSLSRADLVLITNSDQVDQTSIASLKLHISKCCSAPTLVAKGVVTGFYTMSGSPVNLDDKPTFAFCGIANPDYFKRTLEIKNVKISGHHFFRDHHAFTTKDIAQINDSASRVGAKCFVTTEKDAARLAEWKDMFKFEVVVAKWKVEIVEGNDIFVSLIDDVVSSLCNEI